MRKKPYAILLPMLLFTAWSVSAQTYYADRSSELEMNGFGLAVAVGDGEVYVGEPSNTATSGFVYIYRKADGTWTESGRLTASGAVNNDNFGRAIAVSGNTMFIGGTSQPDGRGAIYVFEKDGSGNWVQQAVLAPNDAGEDDNVGTVLAVSGNTAFVGVSQHNDGTGAVYVFHKMGGSWMQHAKLTADDLEAGDRFGSAIAVDGMRALIAAPRHNGGEGAVYVYEDQSGTWAQTTKLQGDGIEANNRFGSSVSLKGDVALVGTPRMNRFMGKVFAFNYDAEENKWDAGTNLVPFDQRPGLQFGLSLVMGEDEVWVGAPGANGFEGRIYQFGADEGGYTGAMKVGAEGVQRGHGFAAMMAVKGDVAVVSSPGADQGLGLATIFERGANGMWNEAAKVMSELQGLAAVTGGQVDCQEGEASIFGCNNVDLVSFVPVNQLGGGRGVRLNDVWGWTDPETGKEYAIVGRIDGTSFVDVSDPYNPVYVGNLSKTEVAPASTWRDMKVYKDHAYIVADGAGAHGMQVFDLTQLRNATNLPIEFEQVAHYDDIASAHNIVINEETGFAYAVGVNGGGETCGGGLHMIDIREPRNPTFAGCFADNQTGRSGTGYSHDAMCIVYNGPDTEHSGKEICFGSNETALSIADVTDKENTVALSNATYPNVGYAHQGWITEDHRYFYMNDELDEIGGNVESTRTMIWDVSDLDDPQLVKEYFSDNKSSDHNLYIKGNYMYQSNYVSGLRVFDISDPINIKPVGYFDTVPFGEDEPGFSGSWSNYPYFKSGIIIVTSGQEGLFILKKKDVDI